MKKLLFLAAALSAACAASAQGYYTDAYNPDITRHTGRIAAQRAEFILPEVNGYNVYKADLHTHSVYSDGDCTPEFRVREGDRLKTVVVYTKMCRGEMTRHILKNRIADPATLRSFEWEGFRLDQALSKGDDWVFTL